MEQDEAHQQQILTTCLEQEEEQHPSIDDNSKKSEEYGTSAETGHCATKLTDDSQSQESPKHSSRREEFSSSEPNVFTAESLTPPSSFYELNLEVPDVSTDDIPTQTSSQQQHEPQIQLAEHQGVFLTQGDFSLEVSQDGNSSECKEIISKSCTTLDSRWIFAQDGSMELSIIKKDEVMSDLCAVAIDYNKQENPEAKDFKQEKVEQIDNATHPSKISDATVKMALTDTLKVFDSITSSGSGDKKGIVKESTYCEQECSDPGPSSVPLAEVKAPKFADSGKGFESSIEEAREALEELNITDFGDNTYQKNGYQIRQITTSDNGSDYEEVSFDVNISDRHIIEVLRRMRSNHYVAEGNEEDLKMYSYCKYLFEKDYKIKVINNEGGTLCKNYPARIIVPYSNHSHSSAVFDPDAYKDLTIKSSGARCRDRFVTPTIFWNGKFICRSATLTVKKSAVYETATKSPPPKAVEADPGSGKRILKHVRAKSESFLHRTSKTAQAMFKLMDLDAMKQYRDDDKKLLEYCQVLHIADLMYEDKKKKFGISVSSSEKIYQESYTDFEILEMPYPGCKFFRRYHEAGRIPNGLIFDWTRSEVNAALKIPNTSNIELPATDWNRYKEWDVVELTQNYMELILAYFMEGESGILIHCISGWDRTPLFIALLRISLWADGLIHGSLSAHEMAYLTLAYDWYLFGHNLPSRVRHGEEIMHFCYNFLGYFTDDHFSATLMWNSNKMKASESESENEGLVLLPFCPEDRVQKIQQLSQIVLELYDEHVSRISV